MEVAVMNNREKTIREQGRATNAVADLSEAINELGGTLPAQTLREINEDLEPLGYRLVKNN